MARLLVDGENLKEPGTAQFALAQWIETAPLEDLLGMHIERAEQGEAVLSMPFRVKLSNGGGVMHGGALTALADTAVAMAIKSLLPESARFATTHLNMKFLAPVHSGRVQARARVSGPSGRRFFGQVDLFDQDDQRVAYFDCEFRLARSAQEASPHLQTRGDC